MVEPSSRLSPIPKQLRLADAAHIFKVYLPTSPVPQDRASFCLVPTFPQSVRYCVHATKEDRALRQRQPRRTFSLEVHAPHKRLQSPCVLQRGRSHPPLHREPSRSGYGRCRNATNERNRVGKPPQTDRFAHPNDPPRRPEEVGWRNMVRRRTALQKHLPCQAS